MGLSFSSFGLRLAQSVASRLALPYKQALFFDLQKQIWVDFGRSLLASNPSVRAGLFAGLVLQPDFFEHDQTHLGHLLGTAEASVQRLLAQALRRCSRFVEIGCAVGYYTVGVARSFNVPTVGYDIDAKAIEAARTLARLNGLEGICQHRQVTPDFDYSTALGEGDLILVDIEGGEIDLFTRLPPLSQTTFIVECHPIAAESPRLVADRIAAMRERTHDSSLYFEGHGDGMAEVEMFGELDRNTVVFAGRTQRKCFPCWLLLVPHGKNADIVASD